MRGPAADEPGALDGRIAVDQPDLVAQGRQPAFDQPDRLDHDRIRTVGRRAIHRREDPRPDRWMDDRLEIAQRRRIGEHDATERRPVERPVRHGAGRTRTAR